MTWQQAFRVVLDDADTRLDTGRNLEPIHVAALAARPANRFRHTTWFDEEMERLRREERRDAEVPHDAGHARRSAWELRHASRMQQIDSLTVELGLFVAELLRLSGYSGPFARPDMLHYRGDAA